MKHIVQPSPSRICGQIAVAVLTGKSVAEVCTIIGHNHGTRTKELREALVALGYDCLKRRPIVRKFPPADSFGIIHIREDGKKWGGHWVAIGEGKAWDGLSDEEISIDNYEHFVKSSRWHITSFLPVWKKAVFCMLAYDADHCGPHHQNDACLEPYECDLLGMMKNRLLFGEGVLHPFGLRGKSVVTSAGDITFDVLQKAMARTFEYRKRFL